MYTGLTVIPKYIFLYRKLYFNLDYFMVEIKKNPHKLGFCLLNQHFQAAFSYFIESILCRFSGEWKSVKKLLANKCWLNRQHGVIKNRLNQLSL